MYYLKFVPFLVIAAFYLFYSLKSQLKDSHRGYTPYDIHNRPTNKTKGLELKKQSTLIIIQCNKPFTKHFLNKY